MGSAFGPLVIGAFYGKNLTHHGALTGLIVGGTIAALWPYAQIDISPLIPGFMSNMIALLVISHLTKKQ